jgi:hypothetical protein
MDTVRMPTPLNSVECMRLDDNNALTGFITYYKVRHVCRVFNYDFGAPNPFLCDCDSISSFRRGSRCRNVVVTAIVGLASTAAWLHRRYLFSSSAPCGSVLLFVSPALPSTYPYPSSQAHGLF